MYSTADRMTNLDQRLTREATDTMKEREMQTFPEHKTKLYILHIESVNIDNV